MPNEFSQIMSTKSDSELLEITTKYKDDYQPEAVEAARIEIENRNLSEIQMQEASEEVISREKEKKNKAEESLDKHNKILFFLAGFSFIPIAMAGTYKANGETRKYKDAWKYIKLSFACTYGLAFFILFIISLTA